MAFGLLNVALDPLQTILGEDTTARLPLVGGLMGSETDNQKALLKKQEQMAAEAKKRMQENERARMNALGQTMLAFNPQNQLMAQMFGPDAAFTPEQFAQMAANPNGPPQLDTSAFGNVPAAQRGADSTFTSGRTETDPKRQAAIDDYYRRKREYEAQQEMIKRGIQAPGPGPAPIKMTAPQAARKF